jgi:hypothetical protein
MLRITCLSRWLDATIDCLGRRDFPGARTTLEEREMNLVAGISPSRRTDRRVDAVLSFISVWKF